MNTKEQIQIVFDLLKKHLRDRKISYAELAQRTHMSEANVKRIFSVRSCDLERLIQFCEASELKFFDLMAEASKVGPNSFVLSTEAEDFFCRDFECFSFFRELSTSSNIQKTIEESRFPKQKTQEFLRSLLKLKLLEKRKSDYHLLYTGYLELSKDSKLRRMIEKEWVPWFFNQLLSSKNNISHKIELFSTGLTDAHRLRLMEDLALLLEKYREIGLTDQKIGRKDYSPIALCIGMGPYRIGRFDNEATVQQGSVASLRPKP